MTPEKRATLLKVFVICLTFVGIATGVLTREMWLPVLGLS